MSHHVLTQAVPTRWRRFLPWPMPALLAWAGGWAAAAACRPAGLEGAGWAFAVGSTVAAVLALVNAGLRRRAIAALGFPLSALVAAGPGGGLSASIWLAALLPLALIYPLRAWRDAPFFPTPAQALRGLDAVVRPAPRSLLDAGCGLGHGLAALQRLWPRARLHGFEWSLPMAWLAARRMPGAQVARADMWARSWADFDLVYLFQRPESMARAWAKATAEMGEGAWLVSLEFPIPGVAPVARLGAEGGRAVHVYRMPGAAVAPRQPRSTGRPPGR
ncbi:MAG: class I SAM-dependent methyltransferase [Burkholderiales bacterium]|nr:class I SAM-dependent methyltransferase [Burkholderiales bacterium]